MQPLYHITPVYLNKSFTPPALDTDKQGYYLVFWWHNFALGHLFLEKGSVLTDDGYNENLIEAILPALHFYSKNSDSIEANWQHWVKQQQFENWSSWMSTLFSSITPDVIPAKVPVSVIICTHNRASQLQQCLINLSRLACLPEEVIVVDNAPVDETTKEVVKQFQQPHKVVYVREPRKGLDIARNAGIRQATSPVVAFVDDDVVVHHQWLYHVWETLKAPDAAAMTGLVIASELVTEAQCIFEKYWSFNRGYTDKIYDSEFLNKTLSKGPPVWRIGAGANMAFRKEAFEKAGYFNELLDAGAAGCSGDSEMWYRLLMHGYMIHYNPRAIVFHEHRKELKGLKKQIFYYMRGHAAAALVQQHYHQKAGYTRYLAKLFLKTYTRSILKGFPGYRYKHSTLWAQIAGALAGLVYYYKNREKPTGVTIK